jgi:hypothetical protein
MADDPRQTNGTIAGLGEKPGVPEGYSVTPLPPGQATPTDPATALPRSVPIANDCEPSTSVGTLGELAGRAGARDQGLAELRALEFLGRAVKPTPTQTQAQENAGLGRPASARP